MRVFPAHREQHREKENTERNNAVGQSQRAVANAVMERARADGEPRRQPVLERHHLRMKTKDVQRDGEKRREKRRPSPTAMGIVD